MHNLPETFSKENLKIFISALSFMLCFFIQNAFSQESAEKAFLDHRKFSLRATTEEKIISVASDNVENLYASLFKGKLMSFSLTSDQKRWQAEFGNSIISTPVVEKENVYIVEGNGKIFSVRSLYAETGITRWLTKFESALGENENESESKFYLYVLSDRSLILIGNRGTLVKIRELDGQIIWSKKLNVLLSSAPLLLDKELFFGTFDNQMVGVNLEGIHTEILQFTSPPTALVQEGSNRRFFVGNKKGALFYVDWQKKNINRRLRAGAEISHLLNVADGILLTSLDNYVYLLDAKGKKLIWKKRLGGRVVNAPQAADGHVIVTATESPVILIIEAETGKLVDKIVLTEGNFVVGNGFQTNLFYVFPTAQGVLTIFKNK